MTDMGWVLKDDVLEMWQGSDIDSPMPSWDVWAVLWEPSNLLKVFERFYWSVAYVEKRAQIISIQINEFWQHENIYITNIQIQELEHYQHFQSSPTPCVLSFQYFISPIVTANLTSNTYFLPAFEIHTNEYIVFFCVTYLT